MTDEQKEFLIKNYPSLGRAESAKQLGISYNAVGFMAKKLQLKVSKETWARFSKIKGSVKKPFPKERMKVDPDKFFNITAPEVAYFLGFIWADGWINIDKITMGILESDGNELLECFSKIGNVSYYRRQYKHYQPQISFQINNRTICEYLISLGYKGKSTKNACLILEKIPKHLQKYWFRGLYEGDGYLFFNQKGSCRMTITGSINQCWMHVENKLNELGCKFNILKDSYLNKKGILNSRSVVALTDRLSIKIFMDYIFDKKEEDGIGLSRKYKVWDEMRKFITERELSGRTRFNIFT